MHLLSLREHKRQPQPAKRSVQPGASDTGEEGGVEKPFWEWPEPDVASSLITLRAKLLLFLLTLGALTALALAAWLWVQKGRYHELFLDHAEEERTEILARKELLGETLRQFAYDYSYWDEMEAMVRQPDPAWARTNIDSVLPTFQADVAWLFTSSLQELYQGSAFPARLPFPVPAEELKGMLGRTRFPHFFARTSRGVMEIYVAPVQPSSDTQRVSTPLGWFAAGRLWNDAVLAKLGEGHADSCRMLQPGEPSPPVSFDSAILTFEIPLANWRGEEVGRLTFSRYSTLLHQIARQTRFQIQAVTLIGLVLFTSLLVFSHYWITRPMRRIIRALREESPDPLVPLFYAKGEFGDLARVICSFFQQKGRLQEEMKHRLRAQDELLGLHRERQDLSRELHDNIIQTIYGIGLQLEVSRKMLPGNQQEAEVLMRRMVVDINQAIHDLRMFLSGLVSTEYSPTRFRDTLEGIVQRYSPHGEPEIRLELSEGALAVLDAVQAFHLVRIVNESISNSIRHANASLIAVKLSREGRMIRLEVSDNGKGAALDRPQKMGTGIINLQSRTHELDGALSFLSGPGMGTRITLELPVTKE
jgi:signal transduction histidine kinase